MLQGLTRSSGNLHSPTRHGSTLNSRKETSQCVVILLVPFFKRVMMTLSAIDSDTEKKLTDGASCFLRIGMNLIKGGWRFTQRRTLCRQNSAHKPVIGNVVTEL